MRSLTPQRPLNASCIRHAADTLDRQTRPDSGKVFLLVLRETKKLVRETNKLLRESRKLVRETKKLVRGTKKMVHYLSTTSHIQ